MEEKKIKDMTGNREEKIASKKPVKEAPAANAPRAPKRPFVRVAYPGADMTEHISKKADAPAGDTPAGEKKEKQHGSPHSPNRFAIVFFVGKHAISSFPTFLSLYYFIIF